MSKLNIYNQLFTRWLFFISSLIVFIYILIFYGFIAEVINNDFTFIGTNSEIDREGNKA